MALIFFVMPYIYAFGTNLSVWGVMGFAVFFWILSGLVFISPLIRGGFYWIVLLVFSITTQAITIAALRANLDTHYRSPGSMRHNETYFSFEENHSPLVLSKLHERYISNAVFMAQRNNFRRGTPVIDLSGMSPTLLYAMGAESIGQPWYLTIFPGYFNLFKSSLTRVDCEKIASAWVLDEPEKYLGVENELMQSLGSDFPVDYTRVATWMTPGDASSTICYHRGRGCEPTARRKQILYKPLDSKKILKKCEALRSD